MKGNSRLKPILKREGLGVNPCIRLIEAILELYSLINYSGYYVRIFKVIGYISNNKGGTAYKNVSSEI